MQEINNDNEKFSSSVDHHLPISTVDIGPYAQMIRNKIELWKMKSLVFQLLTDCAQHLLEDEILKVDNKFVIDCESSDHDYQTALAREVHGSDDPKDPLSTTTYQTPRRKRHV